MLKLNKRLLAVLLAIFMLTATVGCAANNDEPTDTTTTADQTVVTTNPGGNTPGGDSFDGNKFIHIDDNLPDKMDFEQQNIKMLIRQADRFNYEFLSEGTSGDPISNAVYSRELAVEERLNVEIDVEMEPSAQNHGPWDYISTQIAAGTCEYDIIAGGNNHAGTFAVKGDYKNLYNVENLDLSMGYWSQSLVEQMTINETVFAATGAISMYFYDSAFVMFFNKDLCGEYGIEPEGLYEKALTGEWTLNDLITLTENIYDDSGSVQGEKDRGDVYGIGLQCTSGTDAFWSSFDIALSEENDTACSFAPDIGKLSSVVDRMINFIWGASGVAPLAEAEGTAKNGLFFIEGMFSEDHLCFVTDWLRRAGMAEMRNMESEYGILPYPKYDEDQDDYRTLVHDVFTVLSVPRTVQDTEAVGAVLEAMASEGQNSVVPTYYELCLTTKYIDDEYSVGTLNIIIQSISMDTLYLYCGPTGNVGRYLLREQILQKSSTIASDYRTYYSQTNEKIEAMITAFAEYSEN